MGYFLFDGYLGELNTTAKTAPEKGPVSIEIRVAAK